MGSSKGFPSMLRSIDYKLWKRKNCPTITWHGQLKGHCEYATIILEVVTSNELSICHSYFGLPGSHSDLNVFQRSHLFLRLFVGEAPPVNFEVNASIQWDTILIMAYILRGLYL